MLYQEPSTIVFNRSVFRWRNVFAKKKIYWVQIAAACIKLHIFGQTRDCYRWHNSIQVQCIHVGAEGTRSLTNDCTAPQNDILKHWKRTVHSNVYISIQTLYIWINYATILYKGIHILLQKWNCWHHILVVEGINIVNQVQQWSLHVSRWLNKKAFCLGWQWLTAKQLSTNHCLHDCLVLAVLCQLDKTTWAILKSILKIIEWNLICMYETKYQCCSVVHLGSMTCSI